MLAVLLAAMHPIVALLVGRTIVDLLAPAGPIARPGAPATTNLSAAGVLLVALALAQVFRLCPTWTLPALRVKKGKPGKKKQRRGGTPPKDHV